MKKDEDLSRFYKFWTSRFSIEEIREMGAALQGGIQDRSLYARPRRRDGDREAE